MLLCTGAFGSTWKASLLVALALAGHELSSIAGQHRQAILGLAPADGKGNESANKDEFDKLAPTVVNTSSLAAKAGVIMNLDSQDLVGKFRVNFCKGAKEVAKGTFIIEKGVTFINGEKVVSYSGWTLEKKDGNFWLTQKIQKRWKKKNRYWTTPLAASSVIVGDGLVITWIANFNSEVMMQWVKVEKVEVPLGRFKVVSWDLDDSIASCYYDIFPKRVVFDNGKKSVDDYTIRFDNGTKFDNDYTITQDTKDFLLNHNKQQWSTPLSPFKVRHDEKTPNDRLISSMSITWTRTKGTQGPQSMKWKKDTGKNPRHQEVTNQKHVPSVIKNLSGQEKKVEANIKPPQANKGSFPKQTKVVVKESKVKAVKQADKFNQIIEGQEGDVVEAPRKLPRRVPPPSRKTHRRGGRRRMG